jgi:hypothetical protein
MLHESQVAGWPGRTMFDRDGSKVGTIEDVFADERTGNPAWVTVSSGLFGRKHHFVPIAEAREVEDGVAVPLEGALVKDAPRVDQDGELSAEDEALLYRHYGMADEDPGSGASAGDDDRGDGTSAVGVATPERDRRRDDADDRFAATHDGDEADGRFAATDDRDHDDATPGHRDRAVGDDPAGVPGDGGATAVGAAPVTDGEPPLRDQEAAAAAAAGERAVAVARERREREEHEERERRRTEELAQQERAAREAEESERFRRAAAESKAAFLANQAAAEEQGRPAHEAEAESREISAVPYDGEPLDREGHEGHEGQPLDRDRALEDLDAGSAQVASGRSGDAVDPQATDEQDLLPPRDATGDADPAPGDGLGGATDHGPPVPDARFVGRPHVDDDHRVQRDRVIDPSAGTDRGEPASPSVGGTGPETARPGAGTRLRRLVRAITPEKDDHHG